MRRRLTTFLEELDRSTVLAYGGWVVLSLLLIVGTVTTLDRAEYTERTALLARAEAGAATAEQVLLRVFEAVQTLHGLAQTRSRFADAGNSSAAWTIEQQMREVAGNRRLGILDVMVLRPDGSLEWASATPGGANWVGVVPFADLQPPDAATDGMWLSPPLQEPEHKRRIVVATHRLSERGGASRGVVAVVLDPVVLADMLNSRGAEQERVPLVSAQEVTFVQRRPDGAPLTRSRAPLASLSLRPNPNDPVLIAVKSASGGAFRDRDMGIDRLVGFRAPADVPIIVTRSFPTQAALQDFYELRRIVLTVVLALVVGALTATRLFLTNFLLRQRLGEQAMRDPLTGLANRRYFADVMVRRMTEARRQANTALVLVIDLDGFKQVNDTRGHPVGDALLKEVAARLQDCVDPTDTVLRLGGDEFALIRIGRVQRRDATALARYIVNELSEPYEIEGYAVRVSASVGVAMPPEGGEDLNDLLRSADIALYFVKAEGGSAYQLFDPAMENTVRTRRALEGDLREALERRELEVYFQPLVQLEPRRVSGFEALLRWHHPQHGMVMPSRFIPVAEETGLIAPIGEWVLRQSCFEAARWPGQTRVAVNLSPVQFERSDLVDIVASALRESRLEPSRLELEITEGVVMRDIGDVLATMKKLRALGVRLALDDFGTGYSSLSYLRSFPFDKVKIDGSFMADIAGDGGTIIRAVLGLCRHLGLDSLVEGVETEEQLNWLRAEGCTEVQGHYFSPPRPASGVPEIIGGVAGRAVRKSAPAAAG